MVQKFSPLRTRCGTGSTRWPPARSPPADFLAFPTARSPPTRAVAPSATAGRLDEFGSVIHPSCAPSAKGFAEGTLAATGSNESGVSPRLDGPFEGVGGSVATRPWAGRRSGLDDGGGPGFLLEGDEGT